jgi:hypothetical protein
VVAAAEEVVAAEVGVAAEVVEVEVVEEEEEEVEVVVPRPAPCRPFAPDGECSGTGTSPRC